MEFTTNFELHSPTTRLLRCSRPHSEAPAKALRPLWVKSKSGELQQSHARLVASHTPQLPPQFVSYKFISLGLDLLLGFGTGGFTVGVLGVSLCMSASSPLSLSWTLTFFLGSRSLCPFLKPLLLFFRSWTTSSWRHYDSKGFSLSNPKQKFILLLSVTSTQKRTHPKQGSKALMFTILKERK